MVVSLCGVFAAPTPPLPPTGEGRSAENGVAVDMSLLLVDKPGTTSSAARLPPPVGEGLLATRSMVVRAIFLQVFLRHRKRKCRRCPRPSPTGGGRPAVEGAIVAESPPPLQDALASAAGEGAARGVFFQLSMRPPSCLCAKENGHLRGRFPCELFQSVWMELTTYGCWLVAPP